MAGTDKADYKALMSRALSELRELRPEVEAARLARSEPIAIIGLGCRFSGGANDPESFWDLLRGGKEGISDVPPDRWDVDALYDPERSAPGKMCTRRAGFLDDLFGFDARFFDILPNEAATMDPQHRLLLEVSYEALERANIPVDRLYNSRTGVFVGISTFDAAILQLGSSGMESIDPHVGTGSTLSGANGRLSYKFGLTGPSLAIDTACSSSLVAVHYACQSLRRRECDLAITGGVNAILSPAPSINFSLAGMLAPDGRCKTFDARADGYVRGEGCGVLVLKRLSDAERDGDNVLALLRGSAVNQNGPSGGLTVPNGRSQEVVIRDALASADISPGDIAYVEAHGTGTSLGDPIEMNAIAASLCRERSADDPLLVGSVKTNIGHCEAAAGVAGLIKVVLSLQHREIPPHLNFTEPNPHIEWDQTAVQVATEPQQLPIDKKAIAGVSSFGFSGTNAHVVVEGVATTAPSQEPAEPTTRYMLPISARTSDALVDLAERFRTYLDGQPEAALPAICRTAAVGRRQLEVRRGIVGNSLDSVRSQLAAIRKSDFDRQSGYAASRGVVFLFTGQGAQYPSMGRELYQQEAVFRQAMDRCEQILSDLLGQSLLAAMFDKREQSQLDQTQWTQPALFALEYALSEQWRSWGIRPSAVLGHSVGEYVAAVCAGVMSLEDGLTLIASRGRIMQQLDGGMMASVFGDETSIAQAIDPYRDTVSIAALNAPELTVISGVSADVEKALAELTRQGYDHQVLRVSGAFHSPMVDPLIEEFRHTAQAITYRPASTPVVTNVTGDFLAAGATLDADYWCQQMRAPVRFAQAIGALNARGHQCFLEVGPHPVLSALGRQCVPDEPTVWAASLRRDGNDGEEVLSGLGELYGAGAEIDWQSVYPNSRSDGVVLPTYPFQRRSFPIAAQHITPPPSAAQSPATHQDSRPEQAVTMTTANATINDSPRRKARFEASLRDVTQALTGIPAAEIDADQNLFSMGFDSITLMRMRQAVEKDFGVPISIKDLGQLENLSRIAAFLDENLPADPDTPDTHNVHEEERLTQSPAQVHANGESTPMGSADELSELGAIISRQIDLMASQLELLSGHWVDSTPSAAKTPHARHDGSAPVRPAMRDGQTSLPYKRLGKAAKQDYSAGRKQVESLVQQYESRTMKSKEMTQEYRPVFANIRNIAGFRPEWKELIYQIMVDKADGARFTDIDGREYLDITMGFGVYLFGHRPKFIDEAVRASFDSSAPIGPMCPDAGEVARLIHEMTGVDRVAFFNTGSEAVMSALRLARAVTRRPKVVMFSGSYHGHTDNLLATGVNGETLPMVPGTPAGMVEDTWVLTYGDGESIEFIRENGDQIAAVLVEPVQSRRPEFQPSEFLRHLRDVTKEAGTALIFDEVILGFRTDPGGAQAWFDIKADIVTYGKAIGGGMPIGVVAGSSRFLDAIDGGMWRYGDDSVPPEENTFIAGTFNHHPLAMAAARAVLEHLKREGPELQERLNQRTADLARRLDAVFEKAGVPIRVVYFGSLFRFQLQGEWELFCFHLVARGVYIWEGRNCFLSTAHTDDDLDFLIRAVEDSVEEMLKDQAASRAADVAAASEKRLALSAGQYRLFVQAQLAGGELGYHVPIALTVEGPLDASRVQRALDALVQRHDALRTSFSVVDERVDQIVHAEARISLEEISVGEKDVDDAVVEFIRPFNLEEAPLLRVGVGALGDDRHLLIFDSHHIVFDGISGSLAFSDFLRLYHGEDLPEPKKTYADYIDAETAYLKSEACLSDKAYWTSCFSEGLDAVDLPTDRPRPPRKSFSGLRIFRSVDQQRTRALKALASSQHTTLNVVLLAAHFTLLSKLSGARDFAVGTAFDGRPDEDYADVVGTFVNTIAIRGAPLGSKTLATFVKELKQSLLEASDHQRYPYETLVDEMGGAREANRNPFFDTLFVYEYLPTARIEAGDLTFTARDVQNRTAILDITHDVVEVDDGLNMSMEFDTDLFDRATVEGFLEYYVRILDQFLANEADTLSLGGVNLLNSEDRVRQLQTFNATARELPEGTFVDLFEASAARMPDAPALRFGSQIMTYGELNQRANALAHLLIEHAVGPESIVGLAVDRSAEMLVAMLGIFKAGAAYLPIAQDIPDRRLQTIVEDARPVFVLCQSAFAERVVDGLSVIALDSPFADEQLAEKSTENPTDDDRTAPLARSHPGYVIYTSGSTGVPKGVVVTHAGLPGLAGSHIDHLDVSENSRILQFASLTFDAAVAEIVTALSAGASLVLLSEDQRVGTALLDEISRQEVTHVTVPPVVLSTFDQDARLPVECLAVAGEACSGELVERWSADCRFFNIYGPTEASVAVTLSDPLTENRPPPIGLPLWNMRAYILDDHLEPVPQGVAAELYLAGDGLARGYFNQPALTAEKFVPDPYAESPGSRMYRTGDLARRRADGHIEFVGRVDEQLKIRGYRIEPGDVQSALLAQSGVAHAAVVAWEVSPGTRELVAYVVPAANVQLDEEILRRSLADYLPEYMIPAAIITLDALPLTTNGKLDRAQLPAPESSASKAGAVFAEPCNDVQKALVEVWQEVLGRDQVSIHDDFFRLSGDSIKALQVVIRMQQRGYKCLARDLFDHSVLSELSTRVTHAAPVVDQAPVRGSVPLTPVQSWFAQQSLADEGYYSQSVCLKAESGLSEDGLRQVLEHMQMHHDALRMRFHHREGELTQENHGSDLPIDFRQVDLCQAEGDGEASFKSVVNDMQESMDIEQGPLMRVRLVRMSDEDRVVITIHHLVVDAVSWRILVEDLETGYQQYLDGDAIHFPPKTSSYSDWSRYLQELADRNVFSSELDHWHRASQTPDKDSRFDPGIHRDASRITRTVPAAQAERLMEVSRAHNRGVEAVLLAALARALRRHRDSAQIQLTLEHHGRSGEAIEMDVSRTVGWFTAHYPLLLDVVDVAADPGDQLALVEEALADVPNRGIGYGVLRYLQRSDDLTHAPPGILFNYLGEFVSSTPGAHFEIVQEKSGSSVSPRNSRDHELEADAVLLPEGLELSVVGPADGYQGVDVEIIADTWQAETIAIIENCGSSDDSIAPAAPMDVVAIDAEQLDSVLGAAGAQSDEVSAVYPLSPLQEGMLFHKLVDSESAMFINQFGFKIVGSLDVDRFHHSWNEVLARHDALRARFVSRGVDRPAQVVLRQVELPLHHEDLRGLDEDAQDLQIAQFRQTDRANGFDLAGEPLIRIAVFQCADLEYQLVLSFHHILFDGWCMVPMFMEMIAIYRSLASGDSAVLPETRPYGDYVRWLQSQDIDASTLYWQDYLQGFVRPTGLPRENGNGGSRGRQILTVEISEEQTRALNQLLADERITLSSLLRVAWAAVLGKQCGSDDVVFGVLVSGRPAALAGIEEMVGMFINTVPLRIRMDSGAQCVELARRLQSEWLGAESHHYLSLADVQAVSEPGAELLDHVLVIENYPLAEGLPHIERELSGLFSIRDVDFVDQANYPLMIEAHPGDRLQILISFDLDVFRPNLIAEVCDQLETVLNALCETPGIRVGDLQSRLLTDNEKAERADFERSLQSLDEEF